MKPNRMARWVGLALMGLVMAQGVGLGVYQEGPQTISLGDKDQGKALTLQPGDKVKLKLALNAGTGFTWVVAKKGGKVLMEVGKPKLERPEKMVPGGRQYLISTWEAVAEGETEVELHYKRAFEKTKKPAQTFKFSAKVK